MFLQATCWAIFVVAATADDSGDCSLKCLGESHYAWPSVAEKGRGGSDDNMIGPSPRNMACASEKDLADCMDKCTSIAFTNATCTASPAFRDTHSVVCGSDVLEDAQKRFWEHAYNFSAEWARTQQNQCPAFEKHTIEEICEIIYNCTFGQALRSAQLEIMPSPYVIQDEVAAVKLSIYSHLHAKHGDLPESCEPLSEFPPVAHYPNNTEPVDLPTDTDKCALQCIYPLLGKKWFLDVKNLMDSIGAAQLDAMTPLTSCK
ncbi:hypothetical protein AAVH_16704 [Aphelenchoides avenae]|nr:hypothetical protein AAVH_16704 [Aphelenchus avenae]